jgi:hypothetical protein
MTPTGLSAAQGQAQTQCATVSGTTQDAAGGVLANRTVRLRDSNGQIVQTVTSGADGTFTLSNVSPGTYVLEVVNADGSVAGTSTVQVNDDCAPVAGIILTGAGGALAGAAAGGGFFTSTAGIILLGALAAGIAITIHELKEKSPSR